MPESCHVLIQIKNMQAFRDAGCDGLERLRELTAGLLRSRAIENHAEALSIHVPTPDEADELADAILSELANERASGPRLRLGIGIGVGDNPVQAVLEAQNLARQAGINQVAIGRRVFEHLGDPRRDRYGPEESAGNVRLRRGFASALPACFVISPFGAPGSPIRTRANEVFDRILKPVCAATGYRPTRSDMELSAAIRGDLTSALASHPMVVAYLGSPPWSPNVMIEVGYRIALRGSIVFVRDAKEDAPDPELPWDLPFDLDNYQVIDLPPLRDEEAIEAAVRNVSRAVRKSAAETPWKSSHPVAVIDVNLRKGRDHDVILEANPEAAQMFGRPDGVARTQIGKLIASLGSVMPANQFQRFGHEQEILLSQLAFIGCSQEAATGINATVPMFFEGRDDDFERRAFLPVIVRYRHSEADDVLRLTVLYLDVTGATRVDEQGCFVCELKGDSDGFGLIFDLYAKSYDRVLPRLSFYRDVKRRHVKAMSREGIDDVLEVGAGTGNVTLPLLEKGRRVTAVDLSASMLRLLQEKVLKRDAAEDRVRILQRNAENLQMLSAERFDGVSIMLALFTMEDPWQALDEAVRVLRPGGRIIITEPRESFELKPLLEAAEKELFRAGRPRRLQSDWERVTQVNHTIDPSRLAKLRAEQIAEILEHRGFRDVETQGAYLGYCATIEATAPGSPPT